MKHEYTAKITYQKPNGGIASLTITMDEPLPMVKQKARQLVPFNGAIVDIETWEGGERNRPPHPDISEQ